ncbi:Os03g0711525 [Oryza sativa Japonica Group]|uniref:Os03g0711525 protein n=1 Tax=Oryza sativa subsp. japonica TaxID=39947 RepID=A0A0P0W2R7_ORYSJ|nr:hypothetical protein EE612_019996 [Oryza sativa]BAS86029.1 Os03g0711525 [Oryza sativa Japonica Group]
MPGGGATKTAERALPAFFGVSASGRSSRSSRSQPPSSPSSSFASPSSASKPSPPFAIASLASTISRPSSPQSAPAASSSSSSSAFPVASSPPSKIPRITRSNGQSPLAVRGAGGIKRERAFPSGREGIFSPSSAASLSAISVSPWVVAVI